jgi:HK97 family phage portal protein
LGVKYKIFGIPIFEKRQTIEGNMPLSQALDLLEVKSTYSGKEVTPETSMEFSAVYAAVRLIAQTIASLDISVFKKTDKGIIQDLKHPLNYILNVEPSQLFTHFNFWERVCVHLLLYGNAIVRINRERGFIIKDFTILDPEKIEVVEKNGNLFYKDTDNNKVYKSIDVLHFMGMNLSGYSGKSPIQFAKENIGIGIASQELQGSYFKNGTRLDGYLKVQGELSEPAQERLKSSWNKAQAGIKNSYKTALLEGGTEFVKMYDDPEKAQTINTRRFTVEEVARVFGVPLHLLQDLSRSTNNNIEHQSIEFVQHCIRPFCERLEDEMERKLLTEQEKQAMDTFIEFSVDMLLRGDIAGRMKRVETLFKIGAITPNEIRQSERMTKVEDPNADKLYINAANANLDDLNNQKDGNTE